ncbi:MAG: CHAT domain-containing protein [Flavobacteriales bacterium]|nr:CHAT domain-containing protein [Flavobacteriales bacterium]
MQKIAFGILALVFAGIFGVSAQSLEELKKQKQKIMYSGEGLVVQINQLQKLISTIPTQPQYELFKHISLGYTLAHLYSNIGDFDRAIEMNYVALQYFTKQKNDIEQMWCHNDLGVYFTNKSQHDSAYNHFLKGYQLAEKNKLISEKIDMLDGLSFSSIALKDFVSAKNYLQQAENLLNSTKGKDKDIQLVYFYFNQALFYKRQNDTEQAGVFFEKSILAGNDLNERKLVHVRMEYAHLLINTYPQKAKNQLVKNLEFYDLKNNPNAKDPYLIETYMLLAKISVAEKNNQLAYEFVNKSEKQSKYFHELYQFDKSKLFLNEIRRVNLELGIEVCLNLYRQSSEQKWLEKAIEFADQSKSNVHKERLALNRITNNNSQTALVTKRMQLLYQINESEQSEKTKLRASLDSINQQLFGAINANQKDFLVKLLQSKMADNQAVLHYTHSDFAVYAFLVQKNNITYQILDQRLLTSIPKFYQLCQSPNSSLNEFKTIGYAIFNDFIEPLLGNGKDIQQLIIIPDQELSFLPFEALPTAPTGKSWSGINYLMNQYTISYAFSAEALISSNPRTAKFSYTYVGFAPTNYNHDFASLPNSEGLINNFSSTFKGLSFTRAAANYHRAVSTTNSKIIHYYTHGQSIDSAFAASYIVLADRKFYVSDILNLNYQTDLCVINACKVGLGKQYSGEGITSVSWAFSAAGSSHVLNSLWNLNQFTTDNLTTRFLEDYHKKPFASQNLKDAKLAWLANKNIMDNQKQPYYWAGQLLYTNTLYIHPSESLLSRIWVWLILFILFGLGIFWLKNHYKKRRAASRQPLRP